ncbi:hypothetical protein GCM10020295_70770 [Streptomyces cinereospinus]
MIRDEELVDRAAGTGARLLAGLRAIAADRAPGLVIEVRGAGLLIGLELVDASQAGELLLELVDRHVVVNHSLNAHPVVRITPPAVIAPRRGDPAAGSGGRGAGGHGEEVLRPPQF